ncbi:hypothetical protein FJZ28_04945 [Candidatus Peregrinibacteria bacterium]|nr:hypothetical protein [Candidatus Peregrinibacteria bacterium]
MRSDLFASDHNDDHRAAQQHVLEFANFMQQEFPSHGNAFHDIAHTAICELQACLVHDATEPVSYLDWADHTKKSMLKHVVSARMRPPQPSMN